MLSVIASVAIVIGLDKVELFSPTGSCNYNLTRFPVSSNQPIITLVDDKIISFAGYENKVCHIFNGPKSNWTVYSESVFEHDFNPGAVYKNRVYLLDDKGQHYITFSLYPIPYDGPKLKLHF